MFFVTSKFWQFSKTSLVLISQSYSSEKITSKSVILPHPNQEECDRALLKWGRVWLHNRRMSKSVICQSPTWLSFPWLPNFAQISQTRQLQFRSHSYAEEVIWCVSSYLTSKETTFFQKQQRHPYPSSPVVPNQAHSNWPYQQKCKYLD